MASRDALRAFNSCALFGEQHEVRWPRRHGPISTVATIRQRSERTAAARYVGSRGKVGSTALQRCAVLYVLYLTILDAQNLLGPLGA